MAGKEEQGVDKSKVLSAKIVIMLGALLVVFGIAIIIGLQWDVFTEIVEWISEFLIETPCCLGAIVSLLGILVALFGVWFLWLSKNPVFKPETEKEKPKKKSKK